MLHTLADWAAAAQVASVFLTLKSSQPAPFWLHGLRCGLPGLLSGTFEPNGCP